MTTARHKKIQKNPIRSFEEALVPKDLFEWKLDSNFPPDISKGMTFITAAKMACFDESKSDDIYIIDFDTHKRTAIPSFKRKIIVPIHSGLFAAISETNIQFYDAQTLQKQGSLNYETNRYLQLQLYQAKMSRDRRFLLIKTFHPFATKIIVYVVDLTCHSVTPITMPGGVVDIDMHTPGKLTYLGQHGLVEHDWASNESTVLILSRASQVFALSPDRYILSVLLENKPGFAELQLCQRKGCVTFAMTKTIGTVDTWQSSPRLIGPLLLFQDEEEGLVQYDTQTRELTVLSSIDTVHPFLILEGVTEGQACLYYQDNTVLRLQLESIAAANDAARFKEIKSAFERYTAPLESMAQLVTEFASDRYSKLIQPKQIIPERKAGMNPKS